MDFELPGDLVPEGWDNMPYIESFRPAMSIQIGSSSPEIYAEMSSTVIIKPPK